MKPSQLFTALNTLIDCRLPAFIWGPPGIGKSDITAQVTAHRAKRIKGYALRDVRLGMLDPTDIKGFPMPDTVKKHMAWLPPNWLPTKGNGLLFLDEMNAAPPMVQAAAYQLILNRKVGDYELPVGWDVVAAGNNETDRAVTHRMSTALANRLIHLTLEVDLDEWALYASKNDITENTVSFARFRPSLLHNFNPNAKGHAFPSPRSWFFADKIIREGDLKGDTLRQVLCGTVGDGAAGEYLAFLQVVSSLPTREEILLNPTKVPVPTSPAVLHAIVTMLERATTTKTFGPFLDYVNRIPRDYQMAFIKASLAHCPEVALDPTYKTWALTNTDLVT